MDKLTKALSTEHLFTEDDIEALFGGRDAWDTVYANEWYKKEGSDGDWILADYYAAQKAIEYAIEQLTDVLWYFESGNSTLSRGVIERLKAKLMSYEYVWSD